MIPLLVGFSGGQIQLIDPARFWIKISSFYFYSRLLQIPYLRKELSRLYNEERLVDKSRVSCLKWVKISTIGFRVILQFFGLIVLSMNMLLKKIWCIKYTIRWAPGRQDTFLVAHASGQLYTYQVWKEWLIWIQLNPVSSLQAELECGNLPPVYQQQKQGKPKYFIALLSFSELVRDNKF